MGLFKEIFGKKDAGSCCCDVQIVEEDESAVCDCEGSCADAKVVTAMDQDAKNAMNSTRIPSR